MKTTTFACGVVWTKRAYFNKNLYLPIFKSSQMFNAFAMVQVGCNTGESVSTVIYIPALRYVNHVETSTQF